MLPAALKHPLLEHLPRVKSSTRPIWRLAVALPGALRAKYPGAPQEWAWQWVFPATRFYRNATTGDVSLAPALLRDPPVRIGLRHPDDPELLGHRDVSTTMIYTHVLNQGGRGVRSPLDELAPLPPEARTR